MDSHNLKLNNSLYITFSSQRIFSHPSNLLHSNTHTHIHTHTHTHTSSPFHETLIQALSHPSLPPRRGRGGQRASQPPRLIRQPFHPRGGPRPRTAGHGVGQVSLRHGLRLQVQSRAVRACHVCSDGGCREVKRADVYVRVYARMNVCACVCVWRDVFAWDNDAVDKKATCGPLATWTDIASSYRRRSAKTSTDTDIRRMSGKHKAVDFYLYIFIRH